MNVLKYGFKVEGRAPQVERFSYSARDISAWRRLFAEYFKDVKEREDFNQRVSNATGGEHIKMFTLDNSHSFSTIIFNNDTPFMASYDYAFDSYGPYYQHDVVRLEHVPNRDEAIEIVKNFSDAVHTMNTLFSQSINVLGKDFRLVGKATSLEYVSPTIRSFIDRIIIDANHAICVCFRPKMLPFETSYNNIVIRLSHANKIQRAIDISKGLCDESIYGALIRKLGQYNANEKFIQDFYQRT
jgi:hypothetical protein